MKLEYNYESLHHNLHQLWRADKYCDIVLIGGDGTTRISAHRILLEAFSPYFADQSVDADGNIVKEIDVTSIDGVTLQQLVGVCYSGTLEVDEDNVSKIYMGAVHLQLNSLLPIIDNYLIIQLNNDNCIKLYDLAQLYNRKMLFEATKSHICEHFTEIVDQPFFVELNVQKLKQLLALEGLIVRSAEDVFRNVMKWIQHDPHGQRDGTLVQLLPNLRLSSMSQNFLWECVKPLCKTIEAKDFFIAALETRLVSIPSDVGQLPVTVDVGRDQLIIVVSNRGGNCEIMEYCFERHNWNTLAQLPNRVYSFSVTYSKALNSLCFFGGYLNDVLLWNLKTRLFTKLTNMTEPCQYPAVCAIDNESNEDADLIVVGGYTGKSVLSTAQRWSRKSSKWDSLLPIKEAKYGARLVAVGNLVYCVGGNNNGSCVKSVECYNLTEKYRANLASLNHGRNDFGILVDGGKIYVIGGGSDVIEFYDPEKNIWTEVCTMEGSRNIKTCVRHKNRLIAFGQNIVLTSDDDWKTWEKSDTIEAIKEDIYGAFSIPLQH